MLKRSWVEIDLTQLRTNYRILKDLTPSSQKVMAVVKADAYGHGAVEASRVYQEEGCEDFAVSNITEGIELREAGIRGQILILGYTPVEERDTLIKYDITQALIDEEYAEALYSEETKNLKVQWALDTGMNRIGLNTDQPDHCEKVIRDSVNRFHLTGCFTHLCVADTPEQDAFTKEQIGKFKEICERLTDLHLPFMHCMNSAAGLYHENVGDLIRFGIVLYGLKPDYENVLPKGLKPALTWKSVVAMVKDVYPGETIGYGRTFLADHPMRIATIPTGYADGYHRSLSNLGHVIIRGEMAPITGRICMDQFMADVTHIPEVSPSDEVILLGEGYTADDMAQDIGTIGYEIVCDITKRVEREFFVK